MWYHVSQLLGVVVVTGTVLTVMAVPYCVKQNKTDEPRFTQKLGSDDYVRLSHAIPIICCAEGYNNITWHRWEDDTWKHFPPPPDGDYNTPEVEEDGQILRILDAKLTDETEYRCDVEGRSNTIQHTTRLSVVECDILARGPMSVSPFPQNQTICEYGGNLTVHCTGYFGCQDEGNWPLMIVGWYAANVKNVTVVPVTAVSPRYSVKTSQDHRQFKKSAVLTITDVQEEDTQRHFMCILASPQEIKGQTNIKVRIKKDNCNQWLVIGLILGGVVAFVIIFIILVLCCRALYGPQIWLYCCSRISALGPRTIDNEKFLFNLFIYHAEDKKDQDMAQKIQKMLNGRNYKVYISGEMGGNQNVMHTVFEKCHQSAMVLFLYSDALKEDDLANFILQSLITERKGKDILFLEVSTYKAEEVRDWTLHAKDIKELQDENTNQNPLVNDQNEDDPAETEFENLGSVAEKDGVNGVENKPDNIEAAKQSKEIVDDLKFWKVLPRIKCPGNANANSRKMKNFWCSLQNRIPKFEGQRKTSRKERKSRDRNSSIKKPLLDNYSEPPTPMRQNCSPKQFSPNTDEVFKFEESIENDQHLPHRLNQEKNKDLDVSKMEAVIAESGSRSEDESLTSYANTSQKTYDGGLVRGEVACDSITGRDNELVLAADVHHRENSKLPDFSNSSYTVQKSPRQSETSIEEEIEGTTKPMSREEIFTMSDEEPKPGSQGSSYNDENSSGRGTLSTYGSSGSSRHELLSCKSSSGASDMNSEGSMSPQHDVNPDYTNIIASGCTELVQPVVSVDQTHIPTDGPNGGISTGNSHVGKGIGKLNLIINPPTMRSSTSSTPESGYITSPSERSISVGGFLPKSERKIDVIAEEQ